MREGSGKMDRGEDRDLLSSGFFDGNNDRLHNKRLMANDSSRKGEGEWMREEGDITPFQVHSVIQVSCSEDQDNKMFLSSEAQITLPAKSESATSKVVKILRFLPKIRIKI